MSIEASYILGLVKECNSKNVTCDDCKWYNLGRCKAEEAWNIIRNMSNEQINNYPYEIKKQLADILLLDKIKYNL